MGAAGGNGTQCQRHGAARLSTGCIGAACRVTSLPHPPPGPKQRSPRSARVVGVGPTPAVKQLRRSDARSSSGGSA